MDQTSLSVDYMLRIGLDEIHNKSQFGDYFKVLYHIILSI